MADDFEYFAEFLENPSAPEINEFFRMVRRWGKYIEAHKDEFNYLEDDEWKEIRERLLAELEIRIDQKDELGLEWEELDKEIDAAVEAKDEKSLELLNRKLDFMRAYRVVFDIPETDIDEFEILIAGFKNALEDVRKAEANCRLKKLELEISIDELEEEMFSYVEKTGKIPMLPAFARAKMHKGN